MDRQNFPSGAPWESVAGYSRAVRVGHQIEISGTAPVKNGRVSGTTAYDQTMACLEIIQETLNQAGARLEDVVSTRMFVTDISQWEAFAKGHAQYFKNIQPATSMVEVRSLIEPDMLIEIEATAILTDR